MSLLWAESFDRDITHLYDSLRPTPNSAYGLHGDGVQIGDNHSDQIAFVMDNDHGTIYVSMNVNIRQSIGGDWVMQFKDGSNNIGQLKYKPNTKQFCIGDDAGQDVAGTYVSAAFEAWHHVEVKIVCGTTSSNGSCELRVNDGTPVTATGVDFFDGNGYVTGIQIGGSASNDVNSMWLDDLVVYNGDTADEPNDFIGSCQVEYLAPSGNGNSSGMTGSDSNQTDNYLLVDEDPISTTDYVESDTEGDKDTYAMDNLSSTDVTVIGIMAEYHVQKDDSLAKFIRPVLRTNSTDYAGTSVALPESWATIREAWGDNPDTSSAWTAALINSLEVGQEVRDS